MHNIVLYTEGALCYQSTDLGEPSKNEIPALYLKYLRAENGENPIGRIGFRM